MVEQTAITFDSLVQEKVKKYFDYRLTLQLKIFKKDNRLVN